MFRKTAFALLAGCSTAAFGVANAQTAGTAAPAEAAPAPAEAAPTAAESAASDIVVTGSRTITNGNNSPSPVTVVSLSDLQASRPTTLFEGLQDLPQFSASRGGAVGGSTGQGGNNNSIASLNLRALGSLRGLVLFDGHRVAPSNLDGQVDLNQIPQMLIQRVDIQTGGSSAVYGSDAITGVVNFITDRKFNGIKGHAQYGISRYNDDQSMELGLAAGRNLFGGRGHIEGSVQYHKDDGLFRTDRPFIQAPGMWYWTMQGNGSATRPYFLTQNARDRTLTQGGVILSLRNGATVLAPNIANNNFASNGVATPFVNGDVSGIAPGSNFQVGGQGQWVFQKTTLKTPVETLQFFGRFDFDVTDNVHFYANAYHNRGHQFSTLANVRSQASATTALGAGFVMSIDNAFLPAATRAAILAAAPTANQFAMGKVWDSDFYPVQSFDFWTRNTVVTAGLEGEFGGWRWDLSGTRSKNKQNNRANESWSTGRLFAALDAVRDASGNIVCQVSTTANASLYPGCVPMNIFGPTATTQAMWDYVREVTRFYATTNNTDVQGSIAGSPFSTWAGPVNVALSGEYRKLDYLFLSTAEPQNVDPLPCTGLRFNCIAPSANGTNAGTSKIFTNGTSGTPLRRPVWQEVVEGAVEADIPLLKDLSFAQEAGINLAYRHADYTSRGTSASTIPPITTKFKADTWKVGATWRVNDAITLRATRSRDFRAPNLGELYLPGRVQGLQLTQDFLTGATNVLTQGFTGGNSNLKPEVGYTTTVGLVLKPWANFSLAIDGYDIKIKDAITSINGADQAIQQACYASGGASIFCSLQVRPGGFTNTSVSNVATLFLTSAPVNLATIRTHGIDAEANLKLDVAGNPLQLRGLVSYQPKIKTTQPLSPTLDAAGVSSPKLRVQVSVRYKPTDNFTIDWSTRWRSSLKNMDTGSSVNNLFRSPDDLRVDSAHFSNMTLTYAVPSVLGGKLEAYLNILNVFDAKPPVYVPVGGGTLFGQVAGTNGVSFYPSDDAIGRYFNVGMRVRF